MEYQNGTNPIVAESIAFDVTIVDGAGNPIYDTWLPAYGQSVKVKATWAGSVPAPAQAVFRLKMTSNYPGRAVNDPNPAEMQSHGYPSWYYDASRQIDNFHGPDFGLTTAPLSSLDQCNSVDCFSQGRLIVPATETGTYYVYLNCWDYGGRTEIFVTDPVSGTNIGQMWVPEGSDKNGIGSAWVYDQGTSRLDPNADSDAVVFESLGAYNAPLGDDFNNFEEYRGIIYTPTVFENPTHLRLNPYRKDLFVRGVGFDAPLHIGDAFVNAGIDVHDTTSWRHDVTEDGRFFVYYRKGMITGIDTGTLRKVTGVDTEWPTFWPKHEWEFKLDSDNGEDKWAPIGSWSSPQELYLDFSYAGTSGSGSYTIRKPLPHINVLIVRNDKINAFGSSQDGHIQFVGASGPTQQNPLGNRYWRWSTKGYAWCNTTADQASMYGLAVALEKPLAYYFNDKPYKDGGTWNGSGWNGANGKLDPLNAVEDREDQMSPADGIMGDVPNGVWDGDQRLSTYSGQLNPFDINNNRLVELPMASDPNSVDSLYEYDLAQVLRHTYTHEIAHALAGPSHTNDPTCLMYKYSNNWSRENHLGDYYRSLLRVHNKVR